ncbi:MAG: SDR family oxidoreductase [Thermoanaerobaculia bacterium]
MHWLPYFLVYAIVFSLALWRAGFRATRSPEARPAGAAPRPTPSRLLIVGATGGTGRQLVARALDRGHAVTAFVRNPGKLRVDHPRLTIVQGDVLDPATVDTAMRGQEAVLCALGHRRYFYPTRILSQGTRNLLDAMQIHGVPRLVCETSLGIGDGAGRLGLYFSLFVIPVVLPFYFWDKARQERIVAASAAEWIIVRPGMLTNGAARGRCRHGERIGGYVWTARIARADVADFMLDQLAADDYLRRATGACW